MEIVQEDAYGLKRAKAVLFGGGVIIHATDTCYGLAAAIFNQKALGRLYALKKMPENKPVSILVSDLEMAEKYGFFSKKALDLAGKFWPGAVSILVPRKEQLPIFLNPGEEFVSIRLPDWDFARELARVLEMPITTTSANISGERQLYSLREYREFAGKLENESLGGGEVGGDNANFPLPFAGFSGVDLMVDAGDLAEILPSTLVKVSGEGVTVLRQGLVKVE